MYINNINLDFKSGQTDSPILKVVATPTISTSTKIVDSDVTVIKYLELKYIGDQTKLDSAEIVFTVNKSELTQDASLVKLGRYNNGVWTYYTPSSVEDKGIYYSFTVAVPGFSYFAIVLSTAKSSDVVKDATDITKENADVTDADDQTVDSTSKDTGVNTTQSSSTDTKESSSTGIVWWVWTIIGLVVLCIIALIIFYSRKQNKGYNYK